MPEPTPVRAQSSIPREHEFSDRICDQWEYLHQYVLRSYANGFWLMERYGSAWATFGAAIAPSMIARAMPCHDGSWVIQ